MRLDALVYFYRRRLRVHAVQELLAALGVAIGVALVLATTIASHSIAGSAGEVVHTVIGPATVQVRARATDGFDERLLGRVEKLPGVHRAAPILEQTATIRAPNGKYLTVDLAGRRHQPRRPRRSRPHAPDRHPLARRPRPLDRYRTRPETHQHRRATPDRSLSTCAASPLPSRSPRCSDRNVRRALASPVAVMPLADLQRLAGLRGRISRILIQVAPGREAAVRSELRAIVGRIARRHRSRPGRRGAQTSSAPFRPGERVLRHDLRAARLPVRVQRAAADRPGAPPDDRRAARERHAAAWRSCRCSHSRHSCWASSRRRSESSAATSYRSWRLPTVHRLPRGGVHARAGTVIGAASP